MFERRPVEEPRVEISSLVDVVFLLLIFFMVTTTFAERQVVEVALPETEGEPRQVESEIPRCSIDASGAVFLDDERLERGAVREALRTRFEGLSGEDRVLLGRFDDQAPFGSPAEVFDACAKLGIDVQFETEPGAAGSQEAP